MPTRLPLARVDSAGVGLRHSRLAGADLADQRLHNTHWRERFLGHPDDFPER
jgi:hypothetical protein